MHTWVDNNALHVMYMYTGPGMDGYNGNYGSDATDPKMFIDNEKDECQMGTL